MRAVRFCHNLCSRRAGCTVLAILAMAAIGCAGATGNPGAEETGGSLVELQSGLPTGNGPEWYTQKLSDLGYRVASLRYEQEDVLTYQVDKGSSGFTIRVEIDSEKGTASNLEIEPSAAGVVAVVHDTMPSTSPESAPPALPSPDPAPTAAESAPRPAPRAEPAPVPQPRIVVLPAGTLVAARLNDFLDSGKARVGDQFSMSVNEPVVVAGIEVIPVGSRIWGYVADVESARRPNKGGRLVLKADVIEAHGYSVELEGLVTAAEGERLEGKDSVKDDLKEIAVGAGVGGLVGGLLGGGKGVLAGVLIGGGGTFVATKGEQVELPPDTQLYVELREEVSIPVESESESAR